MTIDLLNNFIARYDGDHSELYPILKERMDLEYSCEEVPFKDEFICFEDDYFRIAKEILSRPELCAFRTVVDIGCQYGFQSVIFTDTHKYIGIDACDLRFFETENTTYIHSVFPAAEVDLGDKIVISNMSLGFFSLADNDDIVEALSAAPHLFIRTSNELLEKIKHKYKIIERIHTDSADLYPLFYLH